MGRCEWIVNSLVAVRAQEVTRHQKGNKHGIPRHSRCLRQPRKKNFAAQDYLKGCCVRIICTKEQERARRMEWPGWTQLKGEGVDIDFLQTPCILQRDAVAKNGEPMVAEAELKMTCTPWFWNQVQKKRVGLAIAVSHM